MKRSIKFLSGLLVFCLLLGLCGCAKKSGKEGPSWQEKYDLGVRYLSKGNYQEAILAFTDAIKIDPKQTKAYQSLADAYEKSGDSKQAAETLQKGYEATKDESLKERLKQLQNSNYPEEVRTQFEKLAQAMTAVDLDALNALIQSDQIRGIAETYSAEPTDFRPEVFQGNLSYGDTQNGTGLKLYYDRVSQEGSGRETPLAHIYYGGWKDGLFDGKGVFAFITDFSQPNIGRFDGTSMAIATCNFSKGRWNGPLYSYEKDIWSDGTLHSEVTITGALADSLYSGTFHILQNYGQDTAKPWTNEYEMDFTNGKIQVLGKTNPAVDNVEVARLPDGSLLGFGTNILQETFKVADKEIFSFPY